MTIRNLLTIIRKMNNVKFNNLKHFETSCNLRTFEFEKGRQIFKV